MSVAAARQRNAPEPPATAARPGAEPPAIDDLVARYAPVGRTERRHRFQLRSRVAAGALTAVALAAVLLSTSEIWFGGILSAYEQHEIEINRLKGVLATEIDAVGLQREQLQAQSAEFEVQRRDLAEQIAAINFEWEQLSVQREQIEQQRKLLAGSLQQLDRQRLDLRGRQALVEHQAPRLDAQLAQIEQERRTLERERRRFQEQTALLSRNIVDLGAQRAELERQREQLEAQQREIQALLEQFESMRMDQELDAGESPERLAFSGPAEPTVPVDGLAQVGDGVLGEMRAGLRLENGVEVAIGLTRSASINGVEQFATTVHLEDLTNASPGSLEAFGPVLIQNGGGNTVGPAILDSLSGNFSTIIQNTLDNQDIATTNLYDITIQNASSATRSRLTDNAVFDSLSMTR